MLMSETGDHLFHFGFLRSTVSVPSGHSLWGDGGSSPPQRPMTSDFEG